MSKAIQPSIFTEDSFLTGKTPLSLVLYETFWEVYRELGDVQPYPTKSMIGVATGERRIAWITAIGKNFVHVVFPFPKAYTDNLCFVRIAPVPGDPTQVNHHFRMLSAADLNEEVRYFMRLALQEA